MERAERVETPHMFTKTMDFIANILKICRLLLICKYSQFSSIRTLYPQCDEILKYDHHVQMEPKIHYIRSILKLSV